MENCASSVQYSLGIKASICASRSAMIRSATDCTRPALKPLLTFCQSSGLMEYPTMRSSTRLACWASTRSISILSPDQLIQPELISREGFLDLHRGQFHIGGTDRLMGVLDLLAVLHRPLPLDQVFLTVVF